MQVLKGERRRAAHACHIIDSILAQEHGAGFYYIDFRIGYKTESISQQSLHLLLDSHLHTGKCEERYHTKVVAKASLIELLTLV